MKNKKYNYIGAALISTFLLFSHNNLESQVTVGRDALPLPGALLQLTDTVPTAETDSAMLTATRGLGMPRVKLTSLTDLAPMKPGASASDKEAHTGLTVYNTNTDSPFNKTYYGQGIYTWNGTKWNRTMEQNIVKGSATTAGTGMAAVTFNADLYLPNCYIVHSGETVTVPVAKAYAMWDTWKFPAYTIAPYGGNTLLSSQSEGALGTVFSPSVVWSDVEDLVTVDGGTGNGRTGSFTVQAAAGKTGNAVVQVEIGGKVRWSWHIWVTDYDPNTASVGTEGKSYAASNGVVYKYIQENEAAAYVFMDRNLGATTTTPTAVTTRGLLYQWGRKDPFPGSASISANTEPAIYLQGTNATTTGITKVDVFSLSPRIFLADAIYNPLAFYFNTPASVPGSSASSPIVPPSHAHPVSGGRWSPCDWYTNMGYIGLNVAGKDNNGSYPKDMYSIQHNFLWDDEQKKTPFDPCPEGWRIPGIRDTYSPWFYEDATPYGKYADKPEHYGADNSLWDTNYGHNFIGKTNYELGFYPAAGGRNGYNGNLLNVGTEGYAWRADIPAILVSYGNNVAFSFLFNKTSVRPFGPYNCCPGTEQRVEHANAYSVRCVKEY